MIITKVIETGLDIKNCIDACADLEASVLRILENRFVNRCFRGCFITKINHIVRLGECRITQDGQPNFGSVSVAFEVSAIVFSTGEVIHGCKVVKQMKTGMIICSTQIADIIIAPTPAFASIKTGQIIPVRVGMARYNIGSQKVCINGYHYLPSAAAPVYAVNGEMALGDLHNDVLERIKSEESKSEPLRGGKAWTVFTQLIYPYKSEQKLRGAVEFDLLKPPAGVKYASRDPKVDSLKAVGVSYSDPPDDVVSGLTPDQVLLLLLEDYYSAMRGMREMVETYSTEALISEHVNLWAIYKKNKAD